MIINNDSISIICYIFLHTSFVSNMSLFYLQTDGYKVFYLKQLCYQKTEEKKGQLQRVL